MGWQREVEMNALASSMGMLTVPYVWNEEQAAQMVEAGADLVVAHVGLTASGSVGSLSAPSLEECLKPIQGMADVVKSLSPSTPVLCHGGPIVTPDDARYVIENTNGIVGYFGASSIERIPVERAISDITRQFKSLSVSAP
jgi:predicted TIM-barrel enzyme